MKHFKLSFLLTFSCVAAVATDFESDECKKYFAALAAGDANSLESTPLAARGYPLDLVATAGFNQKKAKWAARRAEVVADDVEELTQIVEEVIPAYQKNVRRFHSAIEKERRKEKPSKAVIAFLEAKLQDDLAQAWPFALDNAIVAPQGYKNLAHFLAYNTGLELPPPEVAKFYGGSVAEKYKALAQYHETFHEVLFEQHMFSKWENLQDTLLLTAQEEAIQIFDKKHPKMKFDSRALRDKPAGSPDREHAKTVLQMAKAMREDDSVPLAHQKMLSDHLSYLEMYRLDPSTLFIEYVESLSTRPKNQPENRD